MLILVIFGTADVQYYDDPDWRMKKKAKKILDEDYVTKSTRHRAVSEAVQRQRTLSHSSMDRRFSFQI